MSKGYISWQRLLICAATFLSIVALAGVASAQFDFVERQTRRPPPPPPEIIKRVKAARPTRPNNGVLFVYSNPPNADVLIDGKKVGVTNAAGELQIQRPANRDYTVTVQASGDLLPFVKQVRLTTREAEFVTAVLRSKFATLTIGPILDDAVILVDGQKPARVERSGTVFIVYIEPGERRIRYEAPGWVPIEGTVKVDAGDDYKLVKVVERARVPLTVTTLPGSTVYVDNVEVGVVPEDGKLRSEVLPGSREVMVSKGGYEPQRDKREFVLDRPVEVSFRLVRNESKGEFSEGFDGEMGRWEGPASGFSVSRGELAVANASAPAIAKDCNYWNFDMRFYVMLRNGGGVSWAARAADPKNYYLFHLSGPEGKFPNKIATYLVRDGQVDLGRPAQVTPLSTKLAAGGRYYIELFARGNVFESFITPQDEKAHPNDWGQRMTMDLFTDQDNHFPYGSFGFRTVGAEQYLVSEITVAPEGTKPKEVVAPAADEKKNENGEAPKKKKVKSGKKDREG